jgi:opacity protein-like surface antigen
MKKTLAVAAVAAFAGVAGAANAADMYSPAGGGLKDTPYVAASTWTGFYLGAHVGGAWSELKNNYNYTETYYDSSTWGYTDSWKNTDSGVFGGGTVGYNYQTGAFVLGFEADFGGIGFSGNHTIYGASGYDTYGTKQDSAFYADVTGRLGYAAGPALFYAKGGWAYLGTGNGFTNAGYSYNGEAWNNGSLDGWVVGGGIEYMWSPNWSVKAEYLHFDFGKKSVDNAYTTGNKWCYTDYAETFSRDFAVDTFKVGINYHFANNYAAPLK